MNGSGGEVDSCYFHVGLRVVPAPYMIAYRLSSESVRLNHIVGRSFLVILQSIHRDNNHTSIFLLQTITRSNHNLALSGSLDNLLLFSLILPYLSRSIGTRLSSCLPCCWICTSSGPCLLVFDRKSFRERGRRTYVGEFECSE